MTTPYTPPIEIKVGPVKFRAEVRGSRRGSPKIIVPALGRLKFSGFTWVQVDRYHVTGFPQEGYERSR